VAAVGIVACVQDVEDVAEVVVLTAEDGVR
jgi:hypothetical protein